VLEEERRTRLEPVMRWLRASSATETQPTSLCTTTPHAASARTSRRNDRVTVQLCPEGIRAHHGGAAGRWGERERPCPLPPPRPPRAAIRPWPALAAAAAHTAIVAAAALPLWASRWKIMHGVCPSIDKTGGGASTAQGLGARSPMHRTVRRHRPRRDANFKAGLPRRPCLSAGKTKL